MAIVEPECDVTALMVDVRNFTLHLAAGQARGDGTREFCFFLSKIYDACATAALTACGSAAGDIHINSTGDGVLIIFKSPRRHFLDAYLAGLVLFHELPRVCRAFNQTRSPHVPDVACGIGIESGTASRVASSARGDGGLPLVDNYIGNCINISARAETTTKDHARTMLVTGGRLHELLCERLFGVDYRRLRARAVDHSVPEAQRSEACDGMGLADRQLLVAFLGFHNLRGVADPVPLYRVSFTLADAARAELWELLRMLCEGDDHYAALTTYLRRADPAPAPSSAGEAAR